MVPEIERELYFYESFYYISDGWTKNDLVYSWYERGPVQIPRNLSLPGGFKLGGYSNAYCDVKTTTGETQKRHFRVLSFLLFSY